ncbi:unnamed protein product [Lupinus luteus]|uniref:Glycosyltransferase family 92 protein n=1 Tax=Lupinus luteus TaxID=3873 RepID=A0AAV1XZF8_LUPLU
MANIHKPSSSNSSYSRVLLLLTILPITLASFAFILQWRGEVTDDSITRGSLDHSLFPGFSLSKQSHSDCSSSPLFPQSHSLSFPFISHSKFDESSNLKPKVCITTTTAGGLEQILPWIFYHKVIGVSDFLLFVEGKAASANVSRVLESIPGVKVIYRTQELEEQQANSRVWNETWLANFFYKPCNYELFVKQSLNMEMAIVMARDSGADWIIHLDTDELVHPAGSQDYSIRQLLSDVPEDVDMVIFPNYESSVERDDIKEPFSEVSMFKKNYDHLTDEVYYKYYDAATRTNPNYFITYGNGKEAARIQDHLRPNGAHRWYNYMKDPKEVTMQEAAVLHYTYPKFSDLISRRDRCGCKPTMEDVKRCFMLEFDSHAFIIASTATEEEMRQWYREHIVWTDKELNSKLLRRGIMTRIYDPMVIVQNLRESGVFSSVIAKAAETTSSVESSNSTRNGNSRSVSSRKIDAGGLSEATARRVLEVIDSSLPSAIPPLSPPTPLHSDLITS